MRPHPVEDVLESVLNACRMQVGALSNEHRGARRDEAPTASRRHFYLIGEAEYLQLGPMPTERIQLHRDDLVVVLGNVRHTLVAADGGAATLHGMFELPRGAASTLLQALPGCLIVRSRDAHPHFGKLVEILRAVVSDVRPGQQILINNLAGSILALAVFEHARQVPGHDEGLASLLDVRIARVLRAIHEHPETNWSIRSLSGIAGMSRSTFALHFLSVVGVPPMRYVTSWRIDKAKQMLQDQRLSVAQVAQMLGYSSEAAFRKLFKRVAGEGPGRARQNAQVRALQSFTQ